MDSIGQSLPEFLVDFDALCVSAEERGLRLLDKDELLKIGLPASSASFRDTHIDTPWKDIAEGRLPSAGPNEVSNAKAVLGMDPVLQDFSFLNRWFVFVKSEAKAVAVKAKDAVKKPTAKRATGATGATGETLKPAKKAAATAKPKAAKL